ncbi:MAG: hypothetical protein RR145_06045, partial [Oscillospiraceae bacterium]
LKCVTMAKKLAGSQHPDKILAMKHGREKSPILQRDERHHAAKSWSLVSPNGTIYKVRNLKNFVRRNPRLFSADEFYMCKNGDILAYMKISALRPTRRICKGRKRPTEWHGWQLEEDAGLE